MKFGGIRQGCNQLHFCFIPNNIPSRVAGCGGGGGGHFHWKLYHIHMGGNVGKRVCFSEVDTECTKCKKGVKIMQI